MSFALYPQGKRLIGVEMTMIAVMQEIVAIEPSGARWIVPDDAYVDEVVAAALAFVGRTSRLDDGLATLIESEVRARVVTSATLEAEREER